jgi:hypothetical protein
MGRRQPLDPVGKGGVVAHEPIGAVGGERKSQLVPADVDVRMVACGLGGVGRWVDEPGRRPEVLAEKGLAMTCRRCAARPQRLQVLGEAALSRMLPLRWSLAPP